MKTLMVVSTLWLVSCPVWGQGASLDASRAELPAFEGALTEPFAGDWLIERVDRSAGVYRTTHPGEIVLDNGLVRQMLRLTPNAALVGYTDLAERETLLRSVRPEALVTLDGTEYAVGGLAGQPEHAYLLPEWLDAMDADPAAFRCVAMRVGPIAERFAWKRVRWSEDRPWPPPGVELQLDFVAPEGPHAGVTVTVHRELYDGLPLSAKWFTLRNGSDRPVRVDAFTSDLLAAVEHESDVEKPKGWETPAIHVETDFSFGGFRPESAEQGVRWVPDPLHSSQVNYQRQTPNLLKVSAPVGPGLPVEPGGTFESFRTWQLVFDSTDRERQGLARRRMYRTIAPWCTENPILMHVRSADPDAVKLAIDQCAEVGFEMVILTFGSGFNIESSDPAYVAQIAELVDYGRSKGVELGGYSLLASRRVSDEHDVIDPETGETGHARFGNSPCLESAWGREYFRKLYAFIEATGLAILEHDGSYPGDVCASTSHPGHEGLADSQWRQFRRIAGFYRWCRGRGVYLNVPDWYFLNGSSKTGMGYRETNWSLPRERQVVLGRQNLYDGTWTKTPSMGWMFCPLVEYHGGGAAATLEPLSEHLDAYGRHLANNFGFGAQACYRGPRLYDAPETQALVERWVRFYREHRRILDADVIHLRRADGRDLDAVLHVDPFGDECAMLVVYNPTEAPLRRDLEVPLYYAGLDDAALVSREGGEASRIALDRRWTARLPVEVPAGGMSWWVFRAP
jgi:hypothetical protein